MSLGFVKINNVKEAPIDSYLFYNLKGGIYALPDQMYKSFAIQWVGLNKLLPLCLDLSSTRQHALIFDLDIKKKESVSTKSIPESIFDLIDSVLKSCFLHSISHFTYIVSSRVNHGGIHVHLPEFTIAHDDYILLCQSLKDSFSHKLDSGEKYILDILQNAMLSGAAKPNSAPYSPIFVVYVEEYKTIKIKICDYKPLEKVAGGFKTRKNNTKSFFRALINNSGKMFERELKLAMMPLVPTIRPLYTLTYKTIIGSEPAQSLDLRNIAQITCYNGDLVNILKSTDITFNGKHLLWTFEYLKINSPQIKSVLTDNHAIKRWSKRFLELESEKKLVDMPEPLQEIHHIIRREHPFISHDVCPLKTVMQYEKGYFFLPVFYALCRHFQIRASELVQKLRPIIDIEFHILLDRLHTLDISKIPFIPLDMTLNTLHFCCNHMYPKPDSMQDKLQTIIRNNRDSILSVTTLDQLVQVVRNLQERHFPIQVLKLRNNLKKPCRFIWNFITESWQEITTNSEINDHLTNLWSNIRSFLNEYRISGGLAGPDNTMCDKFNVSSVTAMINSDTSMERIDVQMDLHKWFLRFKNYAMLDLLSGHFGAVVPEFYMSDRRMGLDFSRDKMIQLCNDSPLLESVYAQLMDKQFMLRFLKNILNDFKPTFYETALVLLQEKVPAVDGDPLALSMLNFFINLNIYMSFDYEMIMYLMDVLTSTLIATNYERKFIVCKGITKNGKSILFETLKAVFGGYFVGIQSENLMPVSQGNTAAPELASSLFSARIVSCEELAGKLNENRVKQITGNSHVTFRNMYEQNLGGIPTAKIFANSNNFPICKTSLAFRDRTVAIPFDANFSVDVPAKISDQVISSTYPITANVTEQSYKGCFFMLYYHLKRFMDPKDGYLHLRNEPAYISEFTQDYLIHTDVYVQFKMHMDVQIVVGTITNLTMLKSAVRQYLKTVKSVSVHETDLLERFDDEFKHRRRTDEQLSIPHYSSMLTEGNDLTFMGESFDSEDDESRKRKQNLPVESLKRKRVDAIVYYEDVAIKNLKSTY